MRSQIQVLVLMLAVVAFGGTVGGLAGRHCEYCSADFERLYWGAGISAVTLVAAAGWHARKRRWIGLAILLIGLLPAAYSGAELAQKMGLWLDRL